MCEHKPIAQHRLHEEQDIDHGVVHDHEQKKHRGDQHVVGEIVGQVRLDAG